MPEVPPNQVAAALNFAGAQLPSGPRLSRRQQATRRVFLRLCGAALSAALAVPVEAHYIEPLAVQVTRHDVFLPDLPLEHDGLRIAHLSDLHRGAVTPDHVIEQAIRLTKRERPDVAVVTGDFVDYDPADAIPLASMIAELSPRLGVWGCLGNHDYHDETGDGVASALTAGCKIQMLRNRGQELLPGLWIAGVEDSLRGHPDTVAALASVPANTAAIVLAHVPTMIHALSAQPHLVLSGHTHGGQVRVPGLAPHLPPGTEGFSVVSGWGTFDRARLFVSRGVGMTGLPVRFRCRPEVAIITLRRGNASPRTHPNLPARAAKKVARVARRAWHEVSG